LVMQYGVNKLVKKFIVTPARLLFASTLSNVKQNKIITTDARQKKFDVFDKSYLAEDFLTIEYFVSHSNLMYLM
jgi:hypothetical protein